MNKQEIINAILDGKTVYWLNTGYKVVYQNNVLYSIFDYNSSMCMLHDREYLNCFIKE